MDDQLSPDVALGRWDESLRLGNLRNVPYEAFTETNGNELAISGAVVF